MQLETYIRLLENERASRFERNFLLEEIIKEIISKYKQKSLSGFFFNVSSIPAAGKALVSRMKDREASYNHRLRRQAPWFGARLGQDLVQVTMVNYLISLCLIFLICKMEKIRVYSLWGD